MGLHLSHFWLVARTLRIIYRVMCICGLVVAHFLPWPGRTSTIVITKVAMMDPKQAKYCMVCVLLSAALPWGLLVLAALISLLSESALLGQISAYMAATGLGVLLCAYLFARLVNSLDD